MTLFNHAVIATLNNLEMRVYHFVIKNRDRVMYMTIRELADGGSVDAISGFEGSVPNPHVKASDWGWQIVPVGLRSHCANCTSAIRNRCLSWKMALAPTIKLRTMVASTTIIASIICAPTWQR